MNDTNPTEQEVRDSIVPKSDQLNADDLIAGPITVTITDVKRGDHEQPISVEVQDNRPYKPCKSMRRVLIAAYSDDPKNWVGKSMTLFCDPEVTWAGVKVGGIRISHMSGIDEPKTFLLTRSRGKRSEVTVLPMATVSDKDIADLTDAINGATDAATITETIIPGKLYQRLKTNGPAADYERVSKSAKSKHAVLKGPKDATSASNETTDES